MGGAKKAGVKLVLAPLENLDDVIKIIKSNPKLFTVWNPENVEKVQTAVDKAYEDIENEKKLSKTSEEEISEEESGVENDDVDFRVMIVDHISTIIKYTLIDNDDEANNESY